MDIRVNYRKFLKRSPDRVLEELPRSMFTDKQYRAVQLRVQGYTFQEIGDIVGVTRQAAEDRVRLTINKYFEYTGQEEFVEETINVKNKEEVV